MEMRLSLDIAWVWCIGCGRGDELDALATLSSLIEYNDKSGDRVKSEKMKGRALACTAFFLQWNKGKVFYDFLDSQNGDQTDSVLQERLSFQTTKLVERLMKAATIGDPFAVSHLAICHYNGDCVPQDKKKAIELYQKASDMGDTSAMNNLAVCYENGDGVPQDKKKAIELYQKASDMGNPNAMVNLALCYSNGDSQDKQKAIELFQKASDMGNTDAMFNLAICYDKGDGVSQDKKKATELYQKAADMGNARALAQLNQQMEVKHCL